MATLAIGKNTICRDLTCMRMNKNKDIIPNDDVFRYYFYFIQERMNMFWRKCEGSSVLTTDSILRRYKFTNVYRACDRVSQYLIRNVIYDNDDKRYSSADILLRILVFKIFNKPETWEYIRQTYGEISCSDFDVKYLSRLLSERQTHFAIFNNAYMMTGSHKRYNNLPTKHEKWLTMVKEEFLGEGIIDDVLHAKSLEEIYNILRKCSFLGSFLAYQYAIDFNYSPYINFDENSFVVAGIGAVRGIQKCFISHGNTYEDAILYTKQHFHELQAKYGFTDFKPLEYREPSLLDLQNCFCETDKYLRVKLPDLLVGNKRIKQIYRKTNQPIQYMFPSKWQIMTFHENNHSIEPTLFDI